MISDETARELLLSAWALGDGTRFARHDGGMGSQTRIVDRGRDRWVVKSGALAAFRRRAPGWPQGLLHADPAPEAFRYDSATASCGIIDWSSALHGTLLYDLASAVMYLGGPDRAAMTDAYQAAGLLSRQEIADGLPVMLRFRWAVQADYFARRLTSNDLTGITGPGENEKGLEDARRALLS